MKHVLYDHHKEHLKNLGVAYIPAALDIGQDEYDAVFSEWKKTLPGANESVLHTKTIGHFAWKSHNEVKEIVPDVPTRSTEFADAVRLFQKLAWVVIVLLSILILTSLRAHAQFSHINSITAQNNDNSQQGFFASPFTFKAGANCAFSVSGSTATFNCSGGAAGAGGSNSQIQWNSTGSLAGISSLTTDGTITTALAGADWLFADLTTPTKKFQFDASNISAATTRTVNIPDANSTTAQAISAVSHKFITQMSAQGVFTLAQPACADISDAGVFCSGTAYSSLTGTPTLPANTTATASNFFTAYNSTTGAFTKTQPAFSDLSGSISVGQSQSLSGDVTGAVNATVVGKVNGVAYAASPSTDTIPVITAANTATYKAVPDCQDSSGNHLNYTASTHAISCGTTSSGGGTTCTGTTCYKLLPWDWIDSNAGSVGVTATNTMYFMRFYLPFGITVAKLAWGMGSCAGGGNQGVAIYSADGTTLLASSGAVACAGTQAVAVSGGPVTLSPGVYIYAWTSTTTTDQFYVRGTGAAVLNNGTLQLGSGATASVGGAPPASLGVLTGSYINAVFVKLQG